MPATHTAKDEAKLLGQLAALKTQIELTGEYRIEDRQGRREMEGSTRPFRRTKKTCPRLSPNKVDHGRRSPASGPDGTAVQQDP